PLILVDLNCGRDDVVRQSRGLGVKGMHNTPDHRTGGNRENRERTKNKISFCFLLLFLSVLSVSSCSILLPISSTTPLPSSRSASRPRFASPRTRSCWGRGCGGWSLSCPSAWSR